MSASPKHLEQTWRWFGPSDPVPLAHIRQAGATGIVSSLHHIPYGQVWSTDEILKRKSQIESAGLRWSVVESVQVHNDIKLGNAHAGRHIEQYQQTIRNLAQVGITTICYNFMPVLDWSRTDLSYPWFDGSTALRFDWNQLVAFDIGILKRPKAVDSYSEGAITKAQQWLSKADPAMIETLTRTMLAGLPGTDEGYSLDEFRSKIAEYEGMQSADLSSNLIQFIRAVTETAEEWGVSLTIHPDDPPFSIFGLPRIMSTAVDVRRLFDAVPSPANGLCFCTGSFGARADNDLAAMVREFADRIGFVHLRNTVREEDGSFTESDHLDGDSDMYAVLLELLREQQKRNTSIPFRPDHGHVMLDDLGKKTNPGYSAIGRLRGLAELRGLEMGILRSGLIA